MSRSTSSKRPSPNRSPSFLSSVGRAAWLGSRQSGDRREGGRVRRGVREGNRRASLRATSDALSGT